MEHGQIQRLRDMPEEYEEIKDKEGYFDADLDDLNLDGNQEFA